MYFLHTLFHQTQEEETTMKRVNYNELSVEQRQHVVLYAGLVKPTGYENETVEISYTNTSSGQERLLYCHDRMLNL